MYLKTPKRYRGRQRAQLISTRTILMLLLIGGLAFAGYQIYENRATLQPQVESIIVNVSEDLNQQMATVNAPPPTATVDPSQNLVSGDNAWIVGNTSEALRNYQMIVGSLPNDVMVHNRLTLGLLALGDSEDGLESAYDAVRANPFDSDAWALLSWAQSENGTLQANDELIDEALASGLHAAALNPNSSRPFVALARATFANEQTTRAQQYIDQALNINPDDYEAYWVRGEIKEIGLFDFAGAEEDYRIAYDIALDSQPITAGAIAVDIALLQARDEDYEGALATLEQARSLNPENSLVIYQIALIYRRDIGNPAQSLTYAQECVDFNSSSYDCYYELGRAQYATDNSEGALLSLISATELNSPRARHWWWVANIYFERGSCQEATPYLQQGFNLITEATPQDLVDAYDFLSSSCNLNLGRPAALPPPTIEPTPEATPEATADV
jgi:tetratricopeptide (TPR) repeat protein